MADKIRKTHKRAVKDAEAEDQKEALKKKRDNFLSYRSLVRMIKEGANFGNEHVFSDTLGAPDPETFQHALKLVKKLKRDKFRATLHVAGGSNKLMLIVD